MKTTLIFIICIFNRQAQATVWNVGPSRLYKFCSEVTDLVKDSDTIQIDNAVYKNDRQVQWTQSNLFIEGVQGRPRYPR